MSESIVTLAAQAGFLVDWQDAHGKTQRVPDETLAALLKQIGLPCDTPDALKESFATLKSESPAQAIAPLITGTIDRAIVLDAGVLQVGMRYVIHLEHGDDVEGVVELASAAHGEASLEANSNADAAADAAAKANAVETAEAASISEPAAEATERAKATKATEAQKVQLAAVAQAGYHQLEIAGHQVCLAIAPVQCFSVADALAASAAEKGSNAQNASANARTGMQAGAKGRSTNSSTTSASNAATNAAIAAPGAIPAHGAPHIVSSAPRLWGLSAQVYGVRRNGDGGVGDFTSLAMLAKESALNGASALAISPMHAMFSADPGKCSPYSPSSRLFVNVLHIDPEHIFGAANIREAVETLNLQPTLSELESAPLIDWQGVAEAKLALLRYCFDQRFIDKLANLPEALSRFREAGGAALEQHARFEALHAYRVQKWLNRNDGDDGAAGDAGRTGNNNADGNAEDSHGGEVDAIADAQAAYDWRYWPKALQDPESDAIAAFVADHRNEVDFHIFLQWLADSGLAYAQQAARDAGMPIGLIADLAVGCDSAGSQTWSQPTTMLQRVSVGAPPDLFNQAGQAWGLTTFSPRALRMQGFRPFTDMVRHAFAHAGGIRVDHILGLRRLWLVPEGESAKNGAYLHYPVEDLLRLLALESWRNRAVVIGEDLGTVPPGLREQLAEAGLLGMRVLWFEREPYDASSPSGGAKISAPASRMNKSAAATGADSRARTASNAHTAADKDANEDVNKDAKLIDKGFLQTTDAHSKKRSDSGAGEEIDKRIDEDGEKGSDKGNNNASARGTDKGIDKRIDKRSDIAAITDLSDIGELDELTDIRGMVSLSDEVDNLFSDDDDESAGREEEHAAANASDTPDDARGQGSSQGDQRVSATAPSPQAASARDTFVPPQRWSTDAIAMTTTHDLPTIVGWWEGQDIVWRQRIGQSSSDEGALRREQAERLTDRALLWRAMIDASVVPAGSMEPAEAPVDAILRLVAMTAAPLALFPMEDILGLEEQPNLPGSTDEHPNWRRRLPFSLEHIKEHGSVAESIYQRWKLIDTSRTASQLAKEASHAPDAAQALAARMKKPSAANTRPTSERAHDAADSVTDGTDGTDDTASTDARSTTRTRSPT